MTRRRTNSERDYLAKKARRIVAEEIKAGNIPHWRGQKCCLCDKDAECYDHRDYRNPLMVAAVCKGCNNRLGPGLPAIDKAMDGLQYSRRAEMDGSAGYLYSNLDAGEGFSPLEAMIPMAVSMQLNWLEEIDVLSGRYSDQDHAINNTKLRILMGFKKGGHRAGFSAPSGIQRYEFFKRHDPWF